MDLDGKRVKKYFGWAFDTSREAYLSILDDVPLFKGMGRKHLRKLLVDLIEKRYAQGDVIFHEGDSGKVLYVVLEGSVRITKRLHSGERTLAILGPGSHFGELALIDQGARFATAAAEQESLLLIMYKSYFDDLIKNNSAISQRILHNLAEILSSYIHAEKTEEKAEETPK
ncbi:MAG TPA: cyclic nucleotide-binding domain-containing protein [Thermodesulfovibrionales bacterium]|nr:cyclic nucleotide-binding domain-containing protein [Thermodesulfovibrionales bacterium]